MKILTLAGVLPAVFLAQAALAATVTLNCKGTVADNFQYSKPAEDVTLTLTYSSDSPLLSMNQMKLHQWYLGQNASMTLKFDSTASSGADESMKTRKLDGISLSKDEVFGGERIQGRYEESSGSPDLKDLYDVVVTPLNLTGKTSTLYIIHSIENRYETVPTGDTGAPMRYGDLEGTMTVPDLTCSLSEK